jgi:hypothetical protein
MYCHGSGHSPPALQERPLPPSSGPAPSAAVASFVTDQLGSFLSSTKKKSAAFSSHSLPYPTLPFELVLYCQPSSPTTRQTKGRQDMGALLCHPIRRRRVLGIKKSRMPVRSRRCHVPQNLCCPIRSVTGYLCVTATNRWDVDFSVQPRRGCPCFLSARTARMTHTGTGGGRTWSHLTSVPRNRDGRFALFCSST